MDLTAGIRSADLILLVYDVSDPETIDRIESDWLPRINTVNAKVRINLVRSPSYWWAIKLIRRNWSSKSNTSTLRSRISLRKWLNDTKTSKWVSNALHFTIVMSNLCLIVHREQCYTRFLHYTTSSKRKLRKASKKHWFAFFEFLTKTWMGDCMTQS